jgi:two-component system OmpR family sensor kinase
LLDVGRLQQGRLPLRFRDMNLADLVRGVVARQASRSEASPVALQLACDPCYIVADADRLEQVVTNLLENAFKYSPHEGTIEMELSGDDAGVSLAVRDYGIGFPAAAAERIFEPFGRAANATERNIPGMGLGLYISRQIVERHGGRLWAESLGEARGTTFHVWLPRAGGAEGA